MNNTAEIKILFLLKSEKNINKTKNSPINLDHFLADFLASGCSDSNVLLDFATSSCLFLVELVVS
jgi:hypothetical protein